MYEQFFFSLGQFIFYFTVFLYFFKKLVFVFVFYINKSSIFESGPKTVLFIYSSNGLFWLCFIYWPCFIFDHVHYVLYIDHGLLFSKYVFGLKQWQAVLFPYLLKDFNKFLKSLLHSSFIQNILVPFQFFSQFSGT